MVDGICLPGRDPYHGILFSFSLKSHMITDSYIAIP